MGKFAYTDPQGVTLFQRHLTAIQAENAVRKAEGRLPSTTPPVTPAPAQPVVKTAIRTDLEKRNALMAQIDKSAMPLVRSGHAQTLDDARSLLFKQDRSLYRDYQKLSYAAGGIPMPAREGGYHEPGKVFQKVQAMARELAAEDIWGKYADRDEQAMMGEIFKLYPSLWKDYREEVSGPAPKDPGRR